MLLLMASPACGVLASHHHDPMKSILMYAKTLLEVVWFCSLIVKVPVVVAVLFWVSTGPSCCGIASGCLVAVCAGAGGCFVDCCCCCFPFCLNSRRTRSRRDAMAKDMLVTLGCLLHAVISEPIATPNVERGCGL